MDAAQLSKREEEEDIQMLSLGGLHGNDPNRYWERNVSLVSIAAL